MRGSLATICLLTAVARAACGEQAAAPLCAAGATCPWDLDAADVPSEVHLLQRGLRSLGAEDSAASAIELDAAAAAAAAHEADAAERSHRVAFQREQVNASRQRLGGSSALQFATPPQVTDVLGAFRKVAYDGTPMAFWKNDDVFPVGYNKTYPPYSEHFQSIVRFQNSNYLLLAGSAHRAGSLFVVDLDSKSSSAGGEFGSNIHGNQLPPDDKVVTVVDVPSANPHAGGIGLWGNVAAVAVEEMCSPLQGLMDPNCPDESEVYFFDFSNLQAPRMLPYHISRPGLPGGAASLVQEPDGTFLLMVGQQHSYILDFYRSTATSLLVDDPGWTLVGSWNKDDCIYAPGQENYGKYQNINMVRQADGKLYFFGTTRDTPVVGWDWVDVYELSLSAPGAPFRATVTKVATQKLNAVDNYCDFYAGGGVYVSSPTQLLVYGVDWVPRDGAVTMMEFGAVSGRCNTDTGGSCSYFGCSSSRNAQCVNKKCVCDESQGFCAVNGACVRTR